MSKTEVSGKQLKDGSVQRVDLDVATSGQSVIAKVVAGDNISISSTGADTGTGDVTISLGGTIAADITSLDSRVDALEGNVSTYSTVQTLNDLTDVTISSPSNDQVLKYNGTAWVNSAAPAAGATNLDGLTDVAVSSASIGQFIVHNGTQFVNSTMKAGTLGVSNTTILAEDTASALTGVDNTFIGYQAGKNSTSGYANTVVGSQAYNSASSATGFQNVCIGTYAGNAATYKAQTVLIGTDAQSQGGGIAGIAIGLGTKAGTKAIAIGYTANSGDNVMNLCWGGAAPGSWSGRIYGDTNGQVGFNETSLGAQLQVTSGAAARKGLIVKGAASQTANLLEMQNSAGTALTLVQSNGTLHAVRYTETVANAFNTSLAPSSGTLTVDTSVGNAVLGALSASVTTWAFTNVPTENSKVTTVSAIVAGNTSYTYGSACSVNGSAVATGVQWFGGTAPSASSSTDVLTFVIIRDSAGTIRVLGSSQTIDAVVGSASAGIDGAGSANYLSKWTDANTIANSAIFESSGNVGIGTTSPDAQLMISSSSTSVFHQDIRKVGNDNTPALLNLSKTRGANTSTNTIVQNGDQVGLISFACADGAGNYLGTAAIRSYVDGAPGANDMPGRLSFWTTPDGASSTVERMRITSNGDVGIGAAPTTGSQLHVKQTRNSLSNGVYSVFIDSTLHNSNLVAAGALKVSTDSQANALVVDGRGTVCMGIGTSFVGTGGLCVRGSDQTGSNYAFATSNSADGLSFSIANNGAIRTGALAASPYNQTTGIGANMYVNSVGDLFRSTSSLKYKEDIQDATHGLNEVLQLRPVTYKSKGQSDGTQVFGGLIAEEVHDVGLTEFVQYAADGTPDALSYGNMVSLAFKAIQELNAKVDALQAEKEALEARLAALENN